MTPLLVHIIFHPRSAVTREAAIHLHRALNDDPAVPGLRIPTVFAAEDGTGLPPASHDLDEAERSVVVVLADDYMNVEEDVPAGRQNWSAFVGDLWEKCQESEKSRHRFLPVQFTDHAWPLDPRLGETSFYRSWGKPNVSPAEWTARAIVIDLCRYLQNEQRGDQLPVHLFLSHAKGDIGTAPQVFNAIVAHLTATQPVEAWVDSADILGGSKFTKAIEDGVRDCALLVLATRNYGSRPWCRKEILLAKRYERPFVIVEALEGLDPRSFPYAGNAPRLRWSDDCAARAVDLVLKETLRHLHMRLVLKRSQQAGDVVLTAPPELTTLVRRPPGSVVLYPDPPLGDEELEELEPLGHRLETPLQRAAAGRALSGMAVVLSISESGDTERHGVTPHHLNAALHEVTRQLLVRGARLHYGGHLGPDGYTTALFDMAAAYSAMTVLPPAERIVNDIGWPQPLNNLPTATRARYKAVARLERIAARPEGVAALEPQTFVEDPPDPTFAADSPARRYAWARGMTAMREAQAMRVQARVILGGKTGPTPKWYSGRIPGVIEEAWVSLKAAQPLYVIGAFGGAANVVADLVEGRPRKEFTWDYQRAAPHAEGMRALYDECGPAWEDYPAMAARFAADGVAELSARNGLSIAANRELFVCRDVTRIVELLLEGLTNVHAKPR
jgi:hypothetical protein